MFFYGFGKSTSLFLIVVFLIKKSVYTVFFIRIQFFHLRLAYS